MFPSVYSDQSFSLHMLIALTNLLLFLDDCSAYEQKHAAGMKGSSPATTPCSTPVSPHQHHVSPSAGLTPKPDRTYPHLNGPQPLPDTAYNIDHRYLCKY